MYSASLTHARVIKATRSLKSNCGGVQRGGIKTGLPWKGNHPSLPTNKEESLCRLNGLVRKLEKSGTINEYNAVIQEQLAQGVVEHATRTIESQEFYIPHKGVVHEMAESTKLRIVYDASAWAWDGAASLNECLSTGLPLPNQLWNVLVRRLPLLGTSRRPFCNSGSVWKRDALRFHWLKSVDSKEKETLRFTRVLFGLAPCPFLLGEVIKQHLESWRPTHPESVCEIQKSLYMDDLITGATTTGKAREMKW